MKTLKLVKANIKSLRESCFFEKFFLIIGFLGSLIMLSLIVMIGLVNPITISLFVIFVLMVKQSKCTDNSMIQGVGNETKIE